MVIRVYNVNEGGVNETTVSAKKEKSTMRAAIMNALRPYTRTPGGSLT